MTIRCEACGQNFDHNKRGQRPKSCPACRTAGGGRLRPVACWVCGAVTLKHAQQSAQRRRVCSDRCKTIVKAGLGSKPDRRSFEDAAARASRPQPQPEGIAAGVTPRDLGWLVGVIETDGGIYATKRATASRPHRPRSIVLQVTNADEAMMVRVARLIGASAPKRNNETPNAAGNWSKPTFRVQLRGGRAEAVYRQIWPDLMPNTKERVEHAFARAGKTLLDPPPRPSPQPDPA